MKGIFRKVINYKNIKYSKHSHSGGTNILYLDCGHILRRKGSIKIPNKAFCKECLTTGGKSEKNN